jgi:glutamyl-tRNA reductase
VQAIIQSEVTDFTAWLRSLDVVPTIVDLRQHMEHIRKTEFQRAMHRLSHLSEQEQNAILAFSQRRVNKILHQPTVRLKQHANDREGYQYAEVLRDLFALSVEVNGPEGERSHG